MSWKDIIKKDILKGYYDRDGIFRDDDYDEIDARIDYANPDEDDDGEYGIPGLYAIAAAMPSYSEEAVEDIEGFPEKHKQELNKILNDAYQKNEVIYNITPDSAIGLKDALDSINEDVEGLLEEILEEYDYGYFYGRN